MRLSGKVAIVTGAGQSEGQGIGNGRATAAAGIRVNTIMPGLIDTPIGVDAVAREFGIDRDQYAELRNEAVPLKGGMGSAWDIANAAVFLASEEARFITGALLPVDGGQSCRVG